MLLEVDEMVTGRAFTFALAALVGWGCGGGPTTESTRSTEDGGTNSSGDTSTVYYSVAIAFVSGASSHNAVLSGIVPADAVDELNVSVSRVEVRPATGGPWVSLAVEEGGDIDLLNLPTDPESAPVVLARGDLDPGDYVDVRLFFGDGAIMLNREVCPGEGGGTDVGSAPCLAAGAHEIFVPSADQTGIKTDASFSIATEGDETTVLLVFDPEATIRNMAWAPGLGKVVVAPVIRAPGEAGGGAGTP